MLPVDSGEVISYISFCLAQRLEDKSLSLGVLLCKTSKLESFCDQKLFEVAAVFGRKLLN